MIDVVTLSDGFYLWKAFQNLMTLHILFASSAEEDAEGKPLPLSSLALSLSDELQYRCAGFVQAEIERYAEELEESKPRPEGSDAESSSSSDSELGDLPGLSNTKKPPPAKKGKEKKKAGDEVEGLCFFTCISSSCL